MNIMKIYLTVLIILNFIVVIQSTSHDHDHEEHAEDPFHALVELTSDQNQEFMSQSGLKRILKKLGERLPESKNCFTPEKITEALKKNYSDAKVEIHEEEFHNISTLLVYFAVEKNCSADIKTAERELLGSEGGNVTYQDVEEIVEKLRSTDYESEEETSLCFNAFQLLNGKPPSDIGEIFAQIILNLFEGLCILPEVEYFRSEFLEYVNATNGIVSMQAFHVLMEKLELGEITEQHEEEADTHESHDEHNHRKRKRRDSHEDTNSHEHEHEISPRCYSSNDLFAIYEIISNISFDQVKQMCPALLHQLVTGACRHHEEENEKVETNDTTTGSYTQAMIYGYGTASVGIISLLALIGMVMFPTLNSQGYKLAMHFLVSLGVSTMAADALLHIIPYILGLHVHGEGEHDEEEDSLIVWKMSVVFGGIYVFYFFESLLGLWTQRRNKKSSLKNDSETTSEAYHDHSHNHTMTSFSNRNGESNQGVEESKSDIANSEEMLPQREVLCYGVNTVCVMVFIGDILHNFGDGLAIGVSFSTSWTKGVGTSLAIFCHELPHEFGDFAIYLKNGASKWKAILLNFVAACCSFIGLYLGISVAQDESTRQWLMAAIAGMFLYISLVEVMHEMLRDKSTKPYLQFLLQNLGLVSGWAILLVIALYEEDIEHSITA